MLSGKAKGIKGFCLRRVSVSCFNLILYKSFKRAFWFYISVSVFTEVAVRMHHGFWRDGLANFFLYFQLPNHVLSINRSRDFKNKKATVLCYIEWIQTLALNIKLHRRLGTYLYRKTSFLYENSNIDILLDRTAVGDKWELFRIKGISKSFKSCFFASFTFRLLTIKRISENSAVLLSIPVALRITNIRLTYKSITEKRHTAILTKRSS